MLTDWEFLSSQFWPKLQVDNILCLYIMSVRLSLQFIFRMCVCVRDMCTWVQCLRRRESWNYKQLWAAWQDAGQVGCKSSICSKLQTRCRLGLRWCWQPGRGPQAFVSGFLYLASMHPFPSLTLLWIPLLCKCWPSILIPYSKSPNSLGYLDALTSHVGFTRMANSPWNVLLHYEGRGGKGQGMISLVHR